LTEFNASYRGGSFNNSSMMIATPSSVCGSAIDLAAL